MALPGTLIANKEAGYQPILLAAFRFADGSFFRASTHNFSAGEGGNSYGGNDYVARIDTQDIPAIQARSEQGVDRISECSLKLHNADQFILLSYELAAGKGFKGAILALTLILCDIDPATGLYVFSNDSPAPVKFWGICDAPGQAPAGGQFLVIRATTSHNLSRIDLPVLHVQQRCVNMFPRNAAERLAGATDMSSWQWGCGYDPDQAGTDPEIGGDCRRGNITTANATDAQGNVIADGAGVYVACNYTKADCVARGMYAKDSALRATGRFTAIQWGPTVAEGQYKSYTQGKNITAFSSRNESIYQRSYPLVDGMQWIKNPIIANVLGDGNAVRFEVVLCSGDIGPDGVDLVVVNGIIVPGNASGVDSLERWNFLDGSSYSSTHTGGRNGIANADAGYNSLGDPYGGLATIEIVVHTELAQSNSIPSVQVRIRGPKLVKYAPIATYASGLITLPAGVTNADIAGNPPFTVQVLGNSLAGANGVWGLTSWAPGPPGTVTLTGAPAGAGTGGYIRYLSRSKNYAWALYDKLIWANYSFGELDIPSFVAAAAICDGSVSYIDLNNNAQTHARFICEQAIEDRTKANEVITAMLRGFNASLVPNSDTGLLQLFIRQTLADQQPAIIPGSNYNTAILSVHADNTTGSGFVAYLIDESVILQDGKGMPQFEGPYALPNAQAPNSIACPFQDADNGYQDDSISVVDPDDVARSAGYLLGGNQNPAGYSVRGLSSFDQGLRVFNPLLAENFRGNPWLDTRGTYFWKPTATSRLEHLRVGHIVLLRYQAQALQPAVQLQSPPGTGITGVLCRVEEIKPASNYERMTVTLKWHEDRWYTDLYGQRGTPGYSDPRQALPMRPPLPWKPYGQQPITGDSMYDASEWSFSVSQNYMPGADRGAIALLAIGGCPPVNSFTSGTGRVQPPLMNSQATTANTGGTIPGGQRIVMAISAQDASGKWSPLSAFTSVTIPSGTNTNTAVTPTISWGAGTAAWVLFAGTGHHTLSAQASGIGTTPSTITIAALNVATYGPPDALADSILLEVKRVLHGGVFGDTCAAIGTGTITFGAAPTTHQFQQIDATHGYDLTVVANPAGSTAPVPIANFHVVDNVGGVYTVTPDPLAAGIVAGTVFEMCSGGFIHSPTTIGDPNFVSVYGPGLTAGFEVGGRVRIYRGKGAGQERNIVGNTGTTLTVDLWDIEPDNTSRFWIEESAWQDQPYAKQSASALTVSPVPTVAVINIPNYKKQTVLVRALIADQNGKTNVSRWAPVRKIYLVGSPGTAGGGMQFNVAGTLAIGSDLAPRVFASQAQTATAVRFVVKIAPTGAALTFNLLLGGVTWMTLSIAAGTTSISATAGQIAAAAAIPANTNMMLDITAVGTTFPGSDLSGAVFF